MFEGISKKLIIVGNKKTDVYCEFLSMLISSKDDKESEENSIVGIEDGSVDSAIWTDNIYLDNRAHTSSKQKIVFIGETDASKNVTPNLAFFEEKEYGVKIGCLGNKAAITIDYDVISNNDFELYSSFYQKYIQFFETYNPRIIRGNEISIKLTTKKVKESAKHMFSKNDGTVQSESHDENVDFDNEENSANPNFFSGTSPLVAKGAVGAAGLLARSTYKLATLPETVEEKTGLPLLSAKEIKDASKREKVMVDQLYRYGVLKFYLYYLKDFLEE